MFDYFQDLDTEDRLGFLLRALNLIEDDGHVTKRSDRRMFYEVNYLDLMFISFLCVSISHR